MRAVLYILVSFLAATTTLFGMLLIYNPHGQLLSMPLTLLEGNVVTNYLIPGILVSGTVGTVNLLAVFYLLQRQSRAYNYAIAGGLLVIVWVILQMMIIASAHWFYFVYLTAGMLTILIAYQLKGKWAL
jgi:hypothetical protein